jgi:hypothetical protein
VQTATPVIGIGPGFYRYQGQVECDSFEDCNEQEQTCHGGAQSLARS